MNGWNLHREHEDRFAIVKGDLELVLFDPRRESPTYGEVCKVMLSGEQRCLVNIPRDVWHAEHNAGSTDVLLVNFPPTPDDHKNPDNYSLPMDSPLIPHSFGGHEGHEGDTKDTRDTKGVSVI